MHLLITRFNVIRCVADASSSNEAVHLQQRLRSLSTELVTLRNRLHVNQPPNNSGPNSGASAPLSKSPEKGGVPSSPAPAVPPRTTLPLSGTLPHGLGHPSGHTLTASAIVHPHVNHAGANTLSHNSTAANNLISGQYAAVHAVHASWRISMDGRCRTLHYYRTGDSLGNACNWVILVCREQVESGDVDIGCECVCFCKFQNYVWQS